jgi:hypothetical protein
MDEISLFACVSNILLEQLNYLVTSDCSVLVLVRVLDRRHRAVYVLRLLRILILDRRCRRRRRRRGAGGDARGGWNFACARNETKKRSRE